MAKAKGPTVETIDGEEFEIVTIETPNEFGWTEARRQKQAETMKKVFSSPEEREKLSLAMKASYARRKAEKEAAAAAGEDREDDAAD